MDLFRLSALMLLLPLLSCSDGGRACQEVRLAAVGDIMLGRYIGKVMKAKGDHYPFAQVKTMLKDHDIVFGNLESGFATDTSTPFFPGKPYNFAAVPGAAPALREAGFTVLNLANNHILDFGSAELDLTRALLQKEGIAAFGAGSGLQAARLPAVVTVRGVRVGFLGYGVAHSSAVYVGKDRAGIVPIQKEYIREDIQALRKTVDVLIVSYHWGMEYEQHPTDAQRDLAHLTIDWGADLVLGHHPHVMQGIEVYKGRPIAYSLGNFVFDQKGMGTDDSFILVCTFGRESIRSVEIVPVTRSHVPRIAEGASKERILGELRRISLPLNSDPAVLTSARLDLRTEVHR